MKTRAKSSTGETVAFVAFGIIAVLFMFGCAAALIMLPLYALMWAWNAFMVPQFGLPPIDLWMALALAILLSFLRSTFSIVNNSRKRSKDGEEE